MNEYDLGDKPRLQVTFAVSGTNTDPTACVLIVTEPDGTHKSYLSASGFSSQGNWDATANSPTLADGTGTAGHYYSVTTAGTIDLGHKSQTFAVGDYVAYDGDVWLLIPSPKTDTLTNSATGIYHYDYPVHQEKVHTYRFEGVGIVHAASEVKFRGKVSKLR